MSSSGSKIYLLIPFGGHGQVESVENVVDLLAFHLCLNASGEEAVTGLTNTVRWAHKPQRHHTKGRSAGLLCLTSVLTCMTPSSVRVLVSITGIPSAVKSAKIFWWQLKMNLRFRASVSQWRRSSVGYLERHHVKCDSYLPPYSQIFSFVGSWHYLLLLVYRGQLRTKNWT